MTTSPLQLPPHLTATTRAFETDQPCQLIRYHSPRPVMTEHHHTKPEFLQLRLWGEVRYGPDLWVCSVCHDAIHAWLYWRLQMHRQPPWIGRRAQAAADATYAWYTNELAAA